MARPFQLKPFIIHALRRLSYRYPARQEAYRAAKIGRNRYICIECGHTKVYERRQVQLDHILPVVDPIEGFVDFNTYITRLFCEQSGFQVLCIMHHKIKTAKERRSRVETRAKKNEGL